jgi:hypothetical protein
VGEDIVFNQPGIDTVIGDTVAPEQHNVAVSDKKLLLGQGHGKSEQDPDKDSGHEAFRMHKMLLGIVGGFLKSQRCKREKNILTWAVTATGVCEHFQAGISDHFHGDFPHTAEMPQAAAVWPMS